MGEWLRERARAGWREKEKEKESIGNRNESVEDINKL